MDLEAENQALRRLLSGLTRDAAYNQNVMERCQERELSLLGAPDLVELLLRLTEGMRVSFALAQVRLVLLDPQAVLAELLDGLGRPAGEFAGLQLLTDLDRLARRFPHTDTPWLGPWSRRSHGGYFATGRLASVALLPLRQPDGLAGFLHLGSERNDRFVPGQATDFLERLARIAAICLENAVNRERLRLTGLTDSLTGLYNRRHLEHRLEQEATRALRHDHPLSCLFIDADHFKAVNDEYGHAAGDQVLVALSRTIRRQLRGSDLATRYGGEEIAVLLPQTDARNARRLAERIREAVANLSVVLNDGRRVRVTVSIGLAELGERDPGPVAAGARMLEQADEAVYVAKRTGRDRVVAHGDAKDLF